MRPDQDENERRKAVERAVSNADVILGDLEDFLAPVRAFQPNLIILGYDQKLPPGVSENDLQCPIERMSAYEPEKYKSSLHRKMHQKTNNKE